MKLSTTAKLLLSSSCAMLLSGASCEQRPDPPTTVEVRVPVPVPCDATEPERPAWAFDAATKEQPLDDHVKKMRAELKQRMAYEAQVLAALRQCLRAPKVTE